MFVYAESIFVVLLEVLCCKNISEIIKEKENENSFWKNNIIIILFMVSVCFTVIFVKDYSVISFGLAGMNIIVLCLYNDDLKHEMKIRENEMLKMQARNQSNMYRSISESFEKQRKKTHEFKNQIMCIDFLVSNKRYQELEEYVKKICGKLYKDFNSIDTNHLIVNAILNAKYQEAVEKDIVFVFRINNLSEIKISDEDLVVILSNLLDNAIEACEKCRGKKVLKMKFVLEDETVIISVKNSYNNNLIYSNGEIQTSKREDADEHGIGIKNIIEIIDKYGGTYVISNNEYDFYFSIVIPQ